MEGLFLLGFKTERTPIISFFWKKQSALTFRIENTLVFRIPATAKRCIWLALLKTGKSLVPNSTQA
jgi:hypothetical protein